MGSATFVRPRTDAFDAVECGKIGCLSTFLATQTYLNLEFYCPIFKTETNTA